MEIGSRFEEITDLWEEKGFLQTSIRDSIFFEGQSTKTRDGFVAIPDALLFERQINRRVIQGFVETNLRAFTAPMPPMRNFVNILRRHPEALKLLGEVVFGQEADQTTLSKPEDTFFLQLVRSDLYDKQVREAQSRGWTVRRIPFDLTDVAQKTVSLLTYSGGFTS